MQTPYPNQRIHICLGDAQEKKKRLQGGVTFADSLQPMLHNHVMIT